MQTRRLLLLCAKQRPIMDNMVGWFRKGVGITSSAGAQSAWADQTGLGGRDYVQAVGANQPAVQADGTILFNGTSHFLKTPAFALVQPYTRYLRIKQITWTLSDVLCDGNTADSGDIWTPGVTPGIALYAGSSAASNGALAVGAWGSVAAVFNGASSSLKVDQTAATTGNPGAASAGGLTLGAQASGAGPANIQVAEEIVYSVAHDAAAQAAVIAYLSTLT